MLKKNKLSRNSILKSKLVNILHQLEARAGSYVIDLYCLARSYFYEQAWCGVPKWIEIPYN